MATELPFEDPRHKQDVDIQHKRGNKAVNDAHIGAAGTISIDFETKSARVHDGETAGGLFKLTAGAGISVIGDNIVYAGTDNDYTITNFDEFSTYSVLTTVGTASISGNVITLTIPSGTPSGYLVLTIDSSGNQREIEIAIGSQIVRKPAILAPSNNATGMMDGITITTSAFETLPNGMDTQLSASYQIASDELFTTIVQESLDDESNLTEITFSSGVLSESGVYYLRARHTGNTIGDSEWSDTVKITMADSFYGEGAVMPDGGIMFAQDSGDWLVCAPATMRAIRKWGLYSTDTSLPNDPDPDPNTGEYNTDVLTSATYNSINDGQGSIGSPAADYSRSVGDGSYSLPNRQELDLIYQKRAIIDAADTSGGAVTLAAIGAGSAPGNTTPNVWSSTEYSANNARFQTFSSGASHTNVKTLEYWVVPVRRISV